MPQSQMENLDSGGGSQVQADRAAAAVSIAELSAQTAAEQLAFARAEAERKAKLQKQIMIGAGVLALIFVLRKK